ncbi:alanyl-tRNA editing protein [Inediibacterium massiliense]|uniref:alanyl-tRNA editing protein n=1 Tax=Inediibacterium massiliense TaxID=1658111 RepID=UPI0006B497FA|nr:alanyl-tRNA editing protein [Inediibacterium massiliense]
MTKKLFYDNIYLKEFTANIVHYEEKNESFHIVLDQTAFYPQGNEQPSDIGTVDDIFVSYVYEKDHQIYHVVDKKPQQSQNLKCSINWENRFDHMQQHLGQHILSACFEELLNVKTIDFHLNKNFSTIDVAINPLSQAQAKRVEYFANQIVFNNFHIKQYYPSVEQIEKMPLRKAPSIQKNIRIVEIDKFDFSPCNGIHPSHTGEVGIIKIIKLEDHKDYTRIEFVCGNRALQDYHLKNEMIHKISNLLSIREKDIFIYLQKIVRDDHLQKKECL